MTLKNPLANAPLPDDLRVVDNCWLTKKEFIVYKRWVYLPHYYVWIRRRNLYTLRKGYKLKRTCHMVQCVNPEHHRLVKGEEEYCISMKRLKRISYLNEQCISERFESCLLSDDYITEW